MAAELAPVTRHTPPLRRGRIVLRSVDDRRDLRYYAYWPETTLPDLPVFVAVHGISINAREQARHFSPWAERTGVLLIAPVFDPLFYGDYQRLGRNGRGARADRALQVMLADLERQAGRLPGRICLFGFSGGAQFAHRFTMAHPDRVAAQVLAAPGWFTFPDHRRRYPYGLRPCPHLPDLSFEPDRFLQVDSHVLVGTRDTLRDASLRRKPKIDRRQGRTRIERGQRWIQAMRKEAAAREQETRFEFDVMEGCGHDFETCMTRGGLGSKTFDFLYAR